MKNNNPGNIRYSASNNWQGQKGQSGGFVVFDNVANGLRAMVKLLATYRSIGVNSIAEIVNRYAPPTENNTASYISFVTNATGYSAGAILSPEAMPTVIAAMVKFEQGQPLASSYFPMVANLVNQFFPSGNGKPDQSNQAQTAGMGTMGKIMLVGVGLYFVGQYTKRSRPGRR